MRSDADRVRGMETHNGDVLRRECRGRWSRVVERHWNDEVEGVQEAAGVGILEGLEVVSSSGRHLRCRVTLEAALQQAKKWSQQWEKWCGDKCRRAAHLRVGPPVCGGPCEVWYRGGAE